MQSIRPKDIYVYFLLFGYYAIVENGLLSFVVFLFTNFVAPFSILYNFLCERFYLPFSYQSVSSQRSTDMEFMLVDALRYNFENLERKWGDQFFSPRLFNAFFKFRYLWEAGAGLGDAEILVDKDTGGNWIRSKSKANTTNDLVVVYVYGAWIVGGSIDMYLEYLNIFYVNLQQQGFKNPAIYIPDIKKDLVNNVVETALGHVHGTYVHPPQLVLAGDSIGATLIMNWLAKPSLTVTNPIVYPSVVLLISPITQLENFAAEEENTAKISDYLSTATITKWLQLVELDSTCPGLLNWSISEKYPPEGMIVSYGTEECITRYTDEFINKLRGNGCKIMVDRQIAQVHNWAIVNFYTEFLVEHREESSHFYCTMISRLLLLKAKGFFDNGGGKIESIVTIDEARL